MPLPTPVALKLVAVLPVENAARFFSPGAEPASITYDVAAQPALGACQVNVSVVLFTTALSALGAPGAVAQPPLCTVTTISFDGALVPPALRARTRTK